MGYTVTAKVVNEGKVALHHLAPALSDILNPLKSHHVNYITFA